MRRCPVRTQLLGGGWIDGDRVGPSDFSRRRALSSVTVGRAFWRMTRLLARVNIGPCMENTAPLRSTSTRYLKISAAGSNCLQ